MNLLKKHLLVITFAVTIVSLGTFTASQVSAANQTAQETLISRLAEKFNLNKADVQSVFDQFHSERHASREAKYEEYLSGLVKDGKITEAQKALLITKHNELLASFRAERNNRQNLTPEERKAQRQAKAQELKDWADQNNIDVKYLMHAGGKKLFRLGYRMGKLQ